MSCRHYPGTNWHRWVWLTMRHYERAVKHYARNGASIGLIENAIRCANYYRDNMGRL